ncbi:transposase [Listeria cornellensis FSL F6-0969]|uniref:Transposase n=1 Tax=Listeria cornellensis FSL F6-0969 TaxID=1265820 RepID=W7BKG8_9LIST|nr:transposase [Listeria cornellensis FSL F6-0969]
MVQEYLKGKQSFEFLANRYDICNRSQLRKWRNQYLAFGQKAFIKKKNRVYTVQMKLDVLHFMKTTGASLQETANHFQIPDYVLISTWKKKTTGRGCICTFETKGRPSLTHKPKKVKTKEMTREQQLE